jgi:hypothetical protein
MAGVSDRVQAFIASWPIVKQQLDELTTGEAKDRGEEEIVPCRACAEALQKQGGGKTA